MENTNNGNQARMSTFTYLFVIVMSVMFNDIHDKLKHNTVTKRVAGPEFAEVMYADDTICISTDTKMMNRMLAAIEEVGEICGIKFAS